MAVSRSARFLVRVFLWSGMPFGVAMALFCSPWNSPAEVLRSGAFAGVFFGFFMSLSVGGMHLLRSASVGQPDPNRVRHEAEVDLPVPLEEAFERGLAAVRALPTLRSVEAASSPTLVRGRTRMTWWSVGERIDVALTPLGEAATRIRIASRPALWTTRMDYGVNYGNVAAIRRALARSA